MALLEKFTGRYMLGVVSPEICITGGVQVIENYATISRIPSPMATANRGPISCKTG